MDFCDTVQSMGALKDLFSSSVAIAETRNTNIDASFLSPPERTYLENVSQNRKREFIAGRFCAHEAMMLASMPPENIHIGGKGEPIWPSNIVGSITHSHGYAAAAVARKSDIISVGLDAEIDEPLSSKALQRISNHQEEEWAKTVGGALVQHPGKVLFSAKEATYKAWYPITHEWLGFKEALINFHDQGNTFTVRILKNGPIREMHGKFTIRNDVILTAIEIPSRKSDI